MTPIQKQVHDCMVYGKEYTTGDIVTLMLNKHRIRVERKNAANTLRRLVGLGKVVCGSMPDGTRYWKKRENKNT